MRFNSILVLSALPLKMREEFIIRQVLVLHSPPKYVEDTPEGTYV